VAYTTPGLVTRDIDIRLQVQWDGGDPLNDATWTNETPYFKSASGNLSLLPGFEHYANNKVQSQEMTVLLANYGNRYSAHVAGSLAAAYASTGGFYHKRVRMQVKENSGAWMNVFSGYAKSVNEDTIKSTVAVTVFDVSEAMRSKHNTLILRDYREHELLAHYMTLAGLTDGVDFISPAYSAASATLDFSSTKVPYSWLDNEEIWQELGEVAQAGSGRIFVNRDGRVCFWKMWRWAGDATPEIIRFGQYNDISPVWDDRSFYDEITVDYADRTPGEPEYDVWTLARAKMINPGATEEIEARTDSPVLEYQTPVANDHYAIIFLGGNDATGSITPTYEWGAQLTKITITNPLSVPVVVAKFTLRGTPLVGSSTEQHSETLETPYTDRRLDVRGNPYIQSKWQAELAAQMWAWWYREPKPMFEISGVRGSAARNLGDRLIVETQGVTVAGPIIKIGWRIAVTKTGGLAYSENYTILDDSRLSGVNNYFIVGETVPVSGKVLWH
jgi:hypothetical protein